MPDHLPPGWRRDPNADIFERYTHDASGQSVWLEDAAWHWSRGTGQITRYRNEAMTAALTRDLTIKPGEVVRIKGSNLILAIDEDGSLSLSSFHKIP